MSTQHHHHHIGFAIIIGAILSIAAANPVTTSGRQLIWSDEFNGDRLDSDSWQVIVNCDGGGNDELQCYQNKSSNVRVEDGKLILEAIKEDYGGKAFTSGRIENRKSLGWRYGRFEARVRIPSGKHLWPAAWLLPQHYTYGTWAASGEVDILEARCELPSQMESTLHYGGQWPYNTYKGSGPKEMGFDMSQDFHVVAFEWSRDEVVWTCDGKEVHRDSLARGFWSGKGANPYTDIRQPFDIPFHWVLNLAVGGPSTAYFRGYSPLTIEEADQWTKRTFEVDYVRVYQ